MATLRFKTTSNRVSPSRGTGYNYDLRNEVHELFHGAGSENGWSFQVIVRKADKSRRCSCWNFTKNEADPTCAKCSGMGFLTYDVVRRTIKKKFIGREEQEDFGTTEFDSSQFFFEYNAGITEDGLLIEVVTNDDGNIEKPVTFIKRHSIRDVEPIRGERGRTEFIRVFVNEGE